MPFVIKKSFNTPEIIIDDSTISFKGRSIPEDSFEFYMPVLEHLTYYFQDPPEETHVVFFFEYINSASKKFLSNIFRMFEKYYANGIKMKITWQYEEDDESIFELGQDLKSFMKIPFILEEII